MSKDKYMTTLRELLNEFTYEQEKEDYKHPIQAEIEKKTYEYGYKTYVKPLLNKLEKAFKISTFKSYDDLKKFILDNHDDKNKDDYHWVASDKSHKYGGDGSISVDKFGIRIPMHIDWEYINDSTSRLHTTTQGDSLDLKCENANDFARFMQEDKILLNGYNFDLMKKLRQGVSSWKMVKGTSFIFKDGAKKVGFTLTDDYKLVPWNGHKTWANRNNPEQDKLDDEKEAAEDKARKHKQHKHLAELVLNGSPKFGERVVSSAKVKFKNAEEFADWLDNHPDKANKLWYKYY